MAKVRDVVVRKFLCKNPYYPEMITWSVESYDSGNFKPNTTVSLDITLVGQGEAFTIRANKRDNTPSVSAALAPINALIDELSRAALAFAKACNTADAKDKAENDSDKEVMKKKAKSGTPKK